jgi:hypothetical protein
MPFVVRVYDDPVNIPECESRDGPLEARVYPVRIEIPYHMLDPGPAEAMDDAQSVSNAGIPRNDDTDLPFPVSRAAKQGGKDQVQEEGGAVSAGNHPEDPALHKSVSAFPVVESAPAPVTSDMLEDYADIHHAW